MDPVTFPPQLAAAAADHPWPLVFATVSGAHLYGFPSPDSDWDLRGVHVLPLREVLGLDEGAGTHELEQNDGAVELDLVTHDARKFAALLLKRNGYVLEQLLSPLVVHTSPAHAALVDLAPGVLTRHHAHHYLGFTANQWKLLEKESVPRFKPLLYAFRTVLTGLHLLNMGEVQANLEVLNAEARLPFLTDLMALKREGREAEPLPGDLSFYRAQHARLVGALEDAQATTRLPAAVPEEVRRAVSDWVVAVRLGELPCS
ncbi:DNA polymerase beta superfamily protein [Deinococcus multiflagellatus]|uniref:DNA polymerase beta superfamily protein n=1 Tax=Deinococcus multiflagellatus TaxID=1656887 RepID=A0ABW1ZP99_9DEIO|nr:nucleotidyltransferase domain-containing protein [Deinococcus multiflagellatus]MBZ9713350.1 nucleotidyltransferase domain-containing protein [Deinococcus multiflagellatus]